MTINLTKVGLLVLAYFLYRQGEEMNEMRAQLRTAERRIQDTTVA